MILAGTIGIIFVCLILILIVYSVDFWPRGFVRGLAYLLFFGSSIETLLLLWVLGIILIGDRPWGLSINEFWKDYLSSIYFLKEWLYTFFWNDLLDFFLAFLPAVLFLFLRSTVTSILGVWLFSVSRVSPSASA